METSIATALAQGKETLVLGDMNIDLLPRQKKGLAKRIMDMCDLFQFKQLITEATRITITSQTHERKHSKQWCYNNRIK